MKKIVGFGFFKPKGSEDVIFNFHYNDDDTFGNFQGVSTGSITIPENLVFGESDNPPDIISIGDELQLVAKISKKGKPYRIVKIIHDSFNEKVSSEDNPFFD